MLLGICGIFAAKILSSSFDKRGNLTVVHENGTWKKQYVYGAMNCLEEAVDAAGKVSV